MLGETLASAGMKAFGTFLSKLAADHAARMLAPDREEHIRTNIAPHMEATFKRCLAIKTLLNPHQPANFLSIYATQRFKLGGQELDHYALIERMRRMANNFIVTGTGGSGKSMFMRYLWLSLFENSEGRIPIFIELRALNALSSVNIESYLHHTLSEGKSRITARDFRKKLEAGDIFVIFDGFDEVSHELRDGIQGAIMDLAKNYPHLKIVVSSRNDDRFASWTTFHVAEVAPMHMEDVVELVTKAEFDASAKSKFTRMVKAHLYQKHRSFMSNPLLASMMLLTDVTP